MAWGNGVYEMNSETLALLRATVEKIDEACALGQSLESVCNEIGVMPRSYRRWKELIAFSRTEDVVISSQSLASILPALEAEFGRLAFAAGEELFRLGDHADHLYVIASGCVRIIELDAMVYAGDVVGEIGVFSQSHCRTASAVCDDDCELIRVPSNRALEICHSRPDIALAMTQLIADRLTQNMAQNMANATELACVA
jgi:CRP-like cAMP-binding protein